VDRSSNIAELRFATRFRKTSCVSRYPDAKNVPPQDKAKRQPSQRNQPSPSISPLDDRAHSHCLPWLWYSFSVLNTHSVITKEEHLWAGLRAREMAPQFHWHCGARLAFSALMDYPPATLFPSNIIQHRKTKHPPFQQWNEL